MLSMQASVREVKRLDSISRSPVYSSIGEALAGLPTIRAYRCEQRLSLRNADLVDGSVIMSLVNMSMNRCHQCPTHSDHHAGDVHGLDLSCDCKSGVCVLDKSSACNQSSMRICKPRTCIVSEG